MTVASRRNCAITSRRRAPSARQQADLAAPLQHVGQHDVHDADAADQQTHARDRTHHDLEDALGLLVLLEQLLRHDQLVVRHARMALVTQDRGQHAGTGCQALRIIQAQQEAVHFILLRLEAEACPRAPQRHVASRMG
ncbi:hypothetical protein [Pseudoxanthomonas mexicana]